jgi:hypothetical protein
MSILAKRPERVSSGAVVARVPVEFEPALEDDAGAAAAEIEPDAKIKRSIWAPLASRPPRTTGALRAARAG